ncbi:MAG TPA: hypothetical protein VFH03_14850, partial [Actinoplanes sp.]|nr:hypothetical protein [Actinoplanes sp.]
RGVRRRPGRPAWERMRPAGAALAVAAVVGVAVAVAGRNDGPDRIPAAAPPAAAATPAATPPATPSATSRATTTAPVRAAGPVLSAAGAVADDSVPTWTQNTVRVRVSRPVVDLAVTISVARTAGVAEAGRYTTVPNTDVITDVRRTPDVLIYSFTLKAGQRLRPGTYEFAAQFDHRPGRKRAADSYAVAARTGSADAAESGRFD